MSDYQSKPLYGGAIVVDLPKDYMDVSTIRDIPDSQEVWIHSDGFTSIIFDITQRIGPSGSNPEIDGRALTEHLEDVVGSDKDTIKLWNTAETDFSRLEKKYPAYTLICTQTPNAKATDSSDRKNPSSAPDFTAIVMTLLRLERYKTDILVTINVPHIKGEYDEGDVDLELGKQGQLIGDAVQHSAKIWESFKIKDWGLFNEGGAD